MSGDHSIHQGLEENKMQKEKICPFLLDRSKLEQSFAGAPGSQALRPRGESVPLVLRSLDLDLLITTQLYKVSSLQTADYGTSQPPL